jgi:hypothetical protein
MQFNDDGKWTRALKFMLSDLKWVVAWIAHQPNPGTAFQLQRTGSLAALPSSLPSQR